MSLSHEGSQEHLTTSRTRGLILGFVFVAAVFNGMLASDPEEMVCVLLDRAPSLGVRTIAY